MDDNDWADLAALADAREFDNVRAELTEPQRAEFDELWELLGSAREDAAAADRIGGELLLHINDSLPGWSDDRKRLAGGFAATLGNAPQLAILAAMFGQGGEAGAVGPGAPPDPPDRQDTVTALRERIRAWLLSAPSRPADGARDASDQGIGGVIRLAGPGGDLRLPLFQFGPDGEPEPVVLAVNEVLGAREDPWGAADWWLGPSVWFPRPPAEMIGRVPDRQLIAAAHAAMDGEW